MLKLVALINDFKSKHINFVALENDIDTTTPLGMVLFTMCAAFSEMERELISERVKAGVHAAHAKGRKGGRPRALTTEKQELLNSLRKSDDLSVTQMCKLVGITRSVYYRAISEEK
jgi:DNA invertase Pin-like site-specific DNA recombinase